MEWSGVEWSVCCTKLTTWLNLVWIIPGAIQLTLILSGANSMASALVRPNSAVLLTEYGPNICGHDTCETASHSRFKQTCAYREWCVSANGRHQHNTTTKSRGQMLQGFTHRPLPLIASHPFSLKYGWASLTNRAADLTFIFRICVYVVHKGLKIVTFTTTQ